MGLFNSITSLFHSSESGEAAEKARTTFRAQRSSALMEGAGNGGLGLSSYVLERGASAPEFLVALMGAFSLMGQFFAFPAGLLFEGRQKGPIFIAAALLLGLAAIGFLLFPAGALFGLWLFFMGVAGAIQTPARNAVFQSNYNPRERSRFLGNVTMFGSIATITMTYLAGFALDLDYRIYRILFPAGLVLIAAAALNYRRIATTPGSSWHSQAKRRRSTILEFIRLFKRDRYFLTFEIAFFTYGCGVMTMWSVLPIYFNKQYDASFKEFSLYAVITTAVMIFAPLGGRWADTRTPPKVAATAFAVLVAVPIILWLAPTAQIAMLAAFVQAFAMIGVHITWNLGPVFFSGGRDASTYSGAHATLAGVRALVAYPFAACLRTSTEQFWPIFLVSGCLLAAASIIMWQLDKRAIRSFKFINTASGRYEVTGEPGEEKK
jgi:MFS family permease